jgi:hypothetical protein
MKCLGYVAAFAGLANAAPRPQLDLVAAFATGKIGELLGSEKGSRYIFRDRPMLIFGSSVTDEHGQAHGRLENIRRVVGRLCEGLYELYVKHLAKSRC